MKKAIKIVAIGLVTFALIANLHSAIFSFYGIKSSNLDGVIWANADDTSTDGPPAGGTSSDASWWNDPVYSTVHCGPMQFSGTTSTHGDASVTYTTSANGTVTATVSYGSVTSGTVSGTVAAHDAKMKQCIGPNDWVICLNVTAQEACQ